MLEALDEPLHVPKLDLLLWFTLTTLCGAAVYGSVTASKQFVAKYDANVNKIVSAEKSVTKLAKGDGGKLRPNAALIKDVDSRRDALNKQSLQLWQALYDRQAKSLIWPKAAGITLAADGAGTEEKGAETKAAENEAPAKKGKKAKGASAKSKAAAKGKQEEIIPPQTCQFYNDNIVRSEFERIFSKLDLRRPKAGSPASLENLPFKEQPADFDGVVAWDPKRRETIVSRHYLSKGAPSSDRVRFVQEDLWIFESLVDVLAPLNKKAKDSLSAPLKQIDVLDVAQWATAARIELAPTIWKPEGAVAGTAHPALKLPGENATDEAFSNGRYLDENGQPLVVGAPQPFAEFKQIVVYMKLVLDQRRLSDLLTSLANASLPVEVRHVSVQVVPDATVREITSADGKAPTQPQAADLPIGHLSIAETTSWDAHVEIGGVVYLYNQPNIKKLGSGAAKSAAMRTFRMP